MAKYFSIKAQKWLNKIGATPMESEIYFIVISQFKKLDRPLQNADIAVIHGTHRTNIRAHLANMIRKGLVKRHRHKFYIPIEAA